MAATTEKTAAVKAGIMPDHRLAGNVLSRCGYYLADGALDANSVIQMVPIPEGARILDIRFYATLNGAGRTMDVGDGNLVDRYFDGLDASAAIQANPSDMDAAYLAPYIYTADDTIDVKILGDTFVDAKECWLTVQYVMDGISDEDWT